MYNGYIVIVRRGGFRTTIIILVSCRGISHKNQYNCVPLAFLWTEMKYYWEEMKKTEPNELMNKRKHWHTYRNVEITSL